MYTFQLFYVLHLIPMLQFLSIYFVDFILDESVRSSVKQAQEKFKQVSSNLHLNVLLYDQLHRDLIKNYKLSPDSVAQLGFQVISFSLLVGFKKRTDI